MLTTWFFFVLYIRHQASVYTVFSGVWCCRMVSGDLIISICSRN